MDIVAGSWCGWWGERSEVGAKNRLLNVIRFFVGGGSWGLYITTPLPPTSHSCNMLQDPVTTVSQIADLIKSGPDPLGLYLSERQARSEINKTFPSQRTRRDAQAFLTELLNTRQQRVAKMPQYSAKRKRPIGLLASSKRAKLARDKYGAKAIDWNAAARLADQAAASAVRRSTETTYSQSGVIMNTAMTPLTQTGYNMSGLNQTAAYSGADVVTRLSRTNACFVWPVSPMAQVGNSSTPGYRKGQRINPIGFRFCITHYQGLPTVQNATYHWAMVRNKSVTLGGNPVIPYITTTTNLQLFTPLIQGPLASAGGPNGVTPVSDFSSSMRPNSQSWTKVKSGSWTMSPMLERANNAVYVQPDHANDQNSAKSITGYVKFKDAHWDYGTPTAITGVKGGDYYFVIWREGTRDLYINSDAMVTTFELSFKDP